MPCRLDDGWIAYGQPVTEPSKIEVCTGEICRVPRLKVIGREVGVLQRPPFETVPHGLVHVVEGIREWQGDRIRGVMCSEEVGEFVSDEVEVFDACRRGVF